MISERLGVIAGRRGDDAAVALLLAHQQQAVQGAALLVGAGELEIFELDVDGRAGAFGQGPAEQGRRLHDGAVDPRRGGLDIGKADGEIGQGGGGAGHGAASRPIWRAAQTAPKPAP